VLEAVFFFQPLHVIVRTRLRGSTELLADDWAATHTGSGLHLARCLAQVSEWVHTGSRPTSLAIAIVEDGGVPATALSTIAFDKSNIDSLRCAFAEAAASLDGDVAVELTGGTKLMGAVLHLAAATRGLDTLYIDYDEYDPRYRKPLPASTYIRLIDSAPWTGLTSKGQLPAFLDSFRASIGSVLGRLEREALSADEIRVLLENILAELDRAR
jgi:hypothetical protein